MVGSDEVLLLTRALATAATAARRAGSLFDLATTGSSSSSGESSRLECELLIDPDDPLRVMALWRTRLPSIGSPSSHTEFSGRSTVRLDPKSGLVSELRVERVRVNGVPITESLGTALAAGREARGRRRVRQRVEARLRAGKFHRAESARLPDPREGGRGRSDKSRRGIVRRDDWGEEERRSAVLGTTLMPIAPTRLAAESVHTPASPWRFPAP